MEIVVLVGKLDGGLLEHDALLHAVAGGKVTGGNIADNDLQRHDGDLLHHGVPLGKLLDKVGGDPGLFHLRHQAVGHLVVDNALAHNGAFFQAVQRGSVILVGYDHQGGILRCINLLGLSFVQLLFLFHHAFSLCKIDLSV